MDAAVIGSELRTHVAEGYAVVVATCDAGLRPQLARVWGLEIAPEGRALTFAVEAPPGSPMRANLAPGAAVALTATKPSTYRSTQIKGRLRRTWQPTDADLARAARHGEAFAENVLEVGIDTPRALRFVHDDVLVVVELEVQEVYDQTPGPAAGARL